MATILSELHFNRFRSIRFPYCVFLTYYVACLINRCENVDGSGTLTWETSLSFCHTYASPVIAPKFPMHC